MYLTVIIFKILCQNNHLKTSYLTFFQKIKSYSQHHGYHCMARIKRDMQ